MGEVSLSFALCLFFEEIHLKGSEGFPGERREWRKMGSQVEFTDSARAAADLP